jgi:hypothetical protein
MSMTRGHREIMGWSDDEIKQDLSKEWKKLLVMN